LPQEKNGHSRGPALLGRVVSALGEPLDGLGPIEIVDKYPAYPQTTNPMQRSNIEQAIGTGIRAIDGLLTCGKGQRIGIFGGSGVGKSIVRRPRLVRK
jgi:flagellar biosynthesis/type III secretory pathway ATPase